MTYCCSKCPNNMEEEKCQFEFFYQKTENRNGGVLMIIKEDISIRRVPCKLPNVCVVNIKGEEDFRLIGVHAPDSETWSSDDLSYFLSKKCIVYGDVNVNIMQYGKNAEIFLQWADEQFLAQALPNSSTPHSYTDSPPIKYDNNNQVIPEVTLDEFINTVLAKKKRKSLDAHVFINVGPTPYVITDYFVVFLDGVGGVKCVLWSAIGLSTCPVSSSIISIVSGGGTSWSHWYIFSSFINVQITSYPWGTGKRYDFIILEGISLISQSSGLCVKFNCPLEQILVAPPQVNINICNAYIRAAQTRLLSPVDANTVNFATIACQNDLTTSGNAKLAQAVVPFLIHSSINFTDTDTYQKLVVTAETNIAAGLTEGDTATTNIIAAQTTCPTQT
ncbi:unnamed protein product, partial [Rotaria sp. Silwood2]